MHQISFGFYSNGHNSRKGDNSDKEKKKSVKYFPWGIHIWNFKNLACMVLDEWMDTRTHGRTDARTHNLKPICTVNFFEVWGIIISLGAIPQFHDLATSYSWGGWFESQTPKDRSSHDVAQLLFLCPMLSSEPCLLVVSWCKIVILETFFFYPPQTAMKGYGESTKKNCGFVLWFRRSFCK